MSSMSVFLSSVLLSESTARQVLSNDTADLHTELGQYLALPAESLLNYNIIYYCYAKPAGIVASILLQVCCVFALLLLFRVLGSTAEDFFSPILTQLSQELGLPPRLAGGVTALAICISFDCPAWPCKLITAVVTQSHSWPLAMAHQTYPPPLLLCEQGSTKWRLDHF